MNAVNAGNPSITGNWVLVRAEMDGSTTPELVAMRVELRLAAGEYLVSFGGEVVDRGAFDVGGTDAVKTIVIRSREGPSAGRAIPCIYQLVGKRLRVCYGLDGTPPTEFSTLDGQNRYLATYRRATGS